MKFSYAMVNSDESRTIYRQMLDADAKTVLAWRDKGKHRGRLPVEQLVTAWWLQKGPTAFDTAGDAAQYRRELTDAVQAHVEEVANA